MKSIQKMSDLANGEMTADFTELILQMHAEVFDKGMFTVNDIT
jgi:hypothetical protein